MQRRLLLLSASITLAVLAGCASGPRPSAPASAGPQPAPGAAAVSLPEEQQRLAELFRDTPVVVEMTPEGRMRVQVPLKFSFDKGHVAVKPPLAKVLDYLARSAAAPGMKAAVHAPSDDGRRPLLARDRAASARDYLVGKGVPVTHFADIGRAGDDNVEIVVGRL